MVISYLSDYYSAILKYKTLLFLFLFTVSVHAQVQETELHSSDFKYALNSAGDEYLFFSIPKPKKIMFWLKSDVCQLTEAEKLKEKNEFTEDAYLIINDKPVPLKLNEQYLSMIPTRVFYDPAKNSLAIIEFYLFSHIGTSLYRYMAVDFYAEDEMSYYELDFNKTQKIRTVYKAYSNRRGQSVIVRLPEND